MTIIDNMHRLVVENTVAIMKDESYSSLGDFPPESVDELADAIYSIYDDDFEKSIEGHIIDYVYDNYDELYNYMISEDSELYNTYKEYLVEYTYDDKFNPDAMINAIIDVYAFYSNDNNNHSSWVSEAIWDVAEYLW